MSDKEDTTFVKWYINRLVFKYKVPLDQNFKKFYSLLHKSNNAKKICLLASDLDKIISKYYADFFLDKSENMGYTEEERKKLREHILQISYDILNNKVPSDQDKIINT